MPSSTLVSTARVRKGKINEVIDYKNFSSFASRYLETYYQKIDSDELGIAKFLVREYSKINGAASMLEIGCGPTIHHILPAAPYVEHIDMADYLIDNLDQIKLWSKQTDNNQGHNWKSFTKHILELEGIRPSMSDILSRERLLKTKIRNVTDCNVLDENPLGRAMLYPAVGFFYCAEEVTTSKNIWKEIMANVANLVTPGGYFFIAALKETDHYIIFSDNGREEKLPTAFLRVEDFSNLLPQLGFDLNNTIIETCETPDQIEHGINGVILISAQKQKLL